MGAVTVGVSLPREGVGTRNLGVGSPVYVRTRIDGTLVIHDREPSMASREVVVQVRSDRPREHVFRDLIAAYLAGAREFVVCEPGGISPGTRDMAKAFTRRTVHPEIVSEEAETLRLREVSRGAELELGPLLRRMFQVVRALQLEAGRSWRDPERLRGTSWEGRDDDVDRQAWFIERILALRQAAFPGDGGLTSPTDSPLSVLVLVRSLERIADHAVRMAENGLRWADTTPSDRLVRAVNQFHRQALDHFSSAFVAAESRDHARANDVLDLGEALHATYATLSESFFSRGLVGGLPAISAVPLGLTLQSIDRTVSYAQDIAEVGLDRSGTLAETGPIRGVGEEPPPALRPTSVAPRATTGARTVDLKPGETHQRTRRN